MEFKSVLTCAAGLLALSLTASGCSAFINESGKRSPSDTRELPASQQTADELSKKYTGYGFKALQNSAEQKLYACIDETINESESREIYTERFDDPKRISDVIEFYKDDHPEVFWIDEAKPYYYANEIDGLTLELNFKFEGDLLNEVKTKLDNAITSALANAPVHGSDYEKELYIHNYLIDHCAYDTEAVDYHKSENEVRANEQNAFGALAEGRAVCEGYARAFQILCDRLNIPCWVIQGQAEGFDNQEITNHIWNCVKLDNDWYHVDVTWDDYDDLVPADVNRYLYFNLTTEEIKKDHRISPLYSDYSDSDVWYNGFVPECAGTDYCYLTLNSLYISDLYDDACGEYVAEHAKNSASCCSFILDEKLDFEEAFGEMVKRRAFDWVSAANRINSDQPEISNNCKLSSVADRRLVTLILDYK